MDYLLKFFYKGKEATTEEEGAKDKDTGKDVETKETTKNLMCQVLQILQVLQAMLKSRYLSNIRKLNHL